MQDISSENNWSFDNSLGISLSLQRKNRPVSEHMVIEYTLRQYCQVWSLTQHRLGLSYLDAVFTFHLQTNYIYIGTINVSFRYVKWL